MKHAFKPFEQDPSVCDTCGELVDNHGTRSVPEGFFDDVWSVMLKYGGVWNQYSSDIHTRETYLLRDHFGIHVPENTWRQMSRFGKAVERTPKPCSVDRKKSSMPEFDGAAAYVFNGTFEEHQEYVSGITGILYCTCGDYTYETVTLPNKTMGQLIWLIVKEGDEK